MGWSSGTEIFDTAVGGILKADLSDKTKLKMISNMINVMYDHDWDTETDSSYIDDKLVRKAFKKISPNLFDYKKE